MRRMFLIAAVIVMTALAGERQPHTRAFHFQYAVTVQDIPVGVKHVDLWLPVPHGDEYQQIENLKIDSPYSYKIAATDAGNKVLHIGLDKPLENIFTMRLSLDAVRQEHIQSRLYGGPPLAQDESEAELAPYLKPDRLVPLDDQIRKWAREVVDQAGAHTDLEMTRAIYDHVVATVKYDKTGKGWGRGDIYYACDARRGNCTDFHAIVIGYARSLGIPARFAIGFPIPAQRGEGKIAGYHCWAEVYIHHVGWIPIDASEAAKDPSKRDYFFGAHDENRIELSKGRDIVLVPKQQGEPLNYFVYPYAEADGAKLNSVAWEVSYRDDNAGASAGK
jgi:transglutaminase-like putative cysteine protease